MEPNTPDEYMIWKDTLYQRARILIEADPASFTLAGHDLAQTFSCELLKEMEADSREHHEEMHTDSCEDYEEMNADNSESLTLDWAPERFLITRICYASSAAIGQSHERLVAKLDFRFSGKIKERLNAARQVILAILLAADANANDYITEEICELAALQYKYESGKIMGRIWVPWDWNENEQHLCPQRVSPNNPPPHAMKTLESAINLVCSQAIKPVVEQTSVQAETKTSTRKETTPAFIQLEEKDIGVLRWLAHPSRRNRAWLRTQVMPDDPRTPTDPRRVRAIINRLHDLGLVDSPPRHSVRITADGLRWLAEN